MPDFCAAYGCSNERNENTKKLGITFHRFPNDKVRRQTWTAALRRKGFQPKHRTVVCSCHFKPGDFDRTGQTTRLKEGAVPSIFKFPDRLSKQPSPSSSSRTSLTAENVNKFPHQRSRSLVRELSLREESTSLSPSSSSRTSLTAENGNKFPRQRSRSPARDQLSLREASTSDHQYAFDPVKGKLKLAESQEMMEKLHRDLRNSMDRERRQWKIVIALLELLKEKHTV